MKKWICGASTLAILSAGHAALAQTSPPGASPEGTANAETSEVIVTGTRQTGVRAADSAQPIEVVGAQAFQHVGQPDITQALQQNVPSFNVQQYGSDAAALTVQAALRGLSPNDTLVLVNGKRRHATANLGTDGGNPYSGSATVDLSYIPIAAIDHIEVLQDGAAAQYGSDAIAGVVNVILKTTNHGGSIMGTGGEYFEGDGATGAWYINKGLDLGGKGFFNITVEERYHDYSQQGGADRRFTNADGSPVSSLSATDRGIVNNPLYPDVNRIVGDTAYNIYDGFYNAGYDLGEGVQLYSFGSYGQRLASAFENTRVPSKVEGVTTTGQTVIPFPSGFNPKEKFNEYDYSFTGGLKGENYGFSWDLASTYGLNHDSVSTVNSANAQLFSALQGLQAAPLTPQQNFYDGAFQFTEWNTSLDVVKPVPLSFLASPLNVAFGAEYRRDTFKISAGDPSSYYGGGAQSFDGYTPLDQGTHARNNYAVYIDLATDPIKNLHLDLAGRYEHYSDFGSDEVGKLTARYDFTPDFAIRGTISTGFRAPTLQEEFYSGTNVGPTSAFIQLPANSGPAALAGFAPLKPEQSSNYSAGLVWHPLPRLQITADYYRIDLRDRIVPSGSIVGLDSTGTVSQGVLDAVAAKGVTLDTGLTYAGISIFTNGVNTLTQGLEATASYASDFGEFGHVDWSVGFNYNDTSVTRSYNLPATVTNVGYGQVTLLTPAEVSALVDGTPKEKAILSAYWTRGPWSVNLREEIYGDTSELVSLSGTGTGTGAYDFVVGATGVTDLDIGYRVTPQLRVNIGANNLFDERPETVPNLNQSGVLRPTDGGNVFGAPATFSPYGINGGYYYGRVTYTF